MFDGRFTNSPHVPRPQALLDARAMVRNPVAVLEKYRAALGPTFSFHFGGARRAIVTTDPELIQHVLRDSRERYEKSDIQVERMVEFQGRGLVNTHGEVWFRQRKLLAKGFFPDRLASTLPMQQAVLAEMMDGFARAAAAGPVDVHQQMVHFTLRLVGNAIFGRQMSERELAQIGETISIIQEFIVRQIVQPYFIPWFRVSGQSRAHQKLRADADELVLKHIAERRAQGGGDDFLSLMLTQPYHDTGEPMGEAQALIESIQLMVAGNETSSNALTWIFYLLARHPSYIAQLRDEIHTIIGAAPVDFHNLHRLQLTQRVVDEALRLYPPFWMIDRIAVKDDEHAWLHIPAGTLVIPYIYGAHRNGAMWSDVERFDPARFEAAASRARHPFAYIPFGGGPRVCIGSNMAIVQILMIVVAVVTAFDFRLEPDAPIGTRPMMLLRPASAVTMRFTPVGRASA